MGCARVRKLLDEDRPAWGAWISMAAPAIAEIAGHAGYDFVAVDMEHSSMDFSAVENLIRAGNGVGISVLVRVPENNPSSILRLADIGSDGIIIPHIRDAADAQRAVEAAKYPPEGKRGIHERCRAAQFGVASADFVSFSQQANRELLVVALIEEPSAADDIDAISAVKGLDVCFVAPSDLSSSMGFIGSRNNNNVARTIRSIAESVRRVGNSKFGIPAFHSAFELSGPAALELGARLITAGQDAGTLLAGFRGHLERATGDS